MNSWFKHVMSGALLCDSPKMHLTFPLYFPSFCSCPAETGTIDCSSWLNIRSCQIYSVDLHNSSSLKWQAYVCGSPKVCLPEDRKELNTEQGAIQPEHQY